MNFSTITAALISSVIAFSSTAATAHTITVDDSVNSDIVNDIDDNVQILPVSEMELSPPNSLECQVPFNGSDRLAIKAIEYYGELHLSMVIVRVNNVICELISTHDTE